MKDIRNYIYLVILSISLILLFITCRMASNNSDNRICTGIEVNIKDSLKISFIESKDIISLITNKYGKIEGKRVEEIDIPSIEKIILSRSAVDICKIYTTLDGKINVDITQREPIIRFQKGDVGFYADKNGVLFPLQNKFTSKVPIIEGNIPIKVNANYKFSLSDKNEQRWLLNVIELITYIESEKKWKGSIQQIHVNNKNELVLVSSRGKEKFLFGQATQIEEKFDKMEKYYRMIRPQKLEKDKTTYSTVDLRYKEQIICR